MPSMPRKQQGLKAGPRKDADSRSRHSKGCTPAAADRAPPSSCGLSEDAGCKEVSLKALYEHALSLPDNAPINDFEQVVNTLRTSIQGGGEGESSVNECVARICFVLFEKLLLKKEDDLVCLVAQVLSDHLCGVDLSRHMASFLSIENSGVLVEKILPEESTQVFLEIFATHKDPVVLRNCAVALPLIYDRSPQQVDIGAASALLESEHAFVRSCYLEVVFRFIAKQAGRGSYEVLSSSVRVIAERVMDINYIVRARALSLLAQLFENNVVQEPEENEVLLASAGRIIDKTQIVRKKAMRLCCTVLCSRSCSTHRPLGESDSGGLERAMACVLKNIDLLLQSSCRGEVDEICELLRVSYLCGVPGTVDVFSSLFHHTVHDKEAFERVLFNLADFLSSLMDRKFEFLLRLRPTVSLEIVIRELARRKVFRDDTFRRVFGMVRSGVQNALHFLSCSIKYIYADTEQVLELMNFISSAFFGSKDEKELAGSVVMYRSMLDILISFRNKDLNSDIVSVLVKNYVKMNFFDYEISEKTMRLCFMSGIGYEKNIHGLVRAICSKNVNRLKILFAVGCIALEQARLIDMIELRAKRLKANLGHVVPREIKERRRSINASRMSIQPRVSDAIETQDAVRNIMEKPEDEISDILFFVKEREMLFGDSLLQPFVPLVIDGCGDEDEEVQNVAYLSLLKCMSVSSEFFEKHMGLFLSGLVHRNHRVRNNCVVAMHDYFVSYNFLLERHLGSLVCTLYDTEQSVRVNAILILFDLLAKNVVRPRGCGTKLAGLLVDEDETVARMSLLLFQKIVKNENMAASILYESLLYGDAQRLKEILVILLPVVTEKVREACFVKLLKYRESKGDILKFYLQHACFAEKFVAEMSTFDDFNELRKELAFLQVHDIVVVKAICDSANATYELWQQVWSTSLPENELVVSVHKQHQGGQKFCSFARASPACAACDVHWRPGGCGGSHRAGAYFCGSDKCARTRIRPELHSLLFRDP
ncbi:UNVERIFIED_CONTAM: hypothetical protein PYX00_011530 [Menopon gallinae]|uniref:Condensin complex subunit 1 C-terminal domain-containing protein n=1 Tax=Menopon gallinae TaxID=328185 RepID=A0AAW2H813_9NEOP